MGAQMLAAALPRFLRRNEALIEYRESGLMRHCRLAPHVYACFAGNAVIFLDTKTSLYFALGGAQARVLRACAASESSVADESVARDVASDQLLREVTQLLQQRHLLASDVSTGKAIVPTSIPSAQSVLLREHLAGRPPVRLHHIINFLWACGRAAFSLRACSLDQTLRRLRARQRGGVHVDVDRSRALLRVFFRLRPFVFSAHKACLFDSLALTEFMARYDIHATWAIGVRTNPFKAHCWVQQATYVLNDNVENVRLFTPIVAA